MGINSTDCYWKQIYEPLALGANHNNFNYTKGSISHVKTFQILPFLLSYFKSGQNYKVLLKTQDGVEGYFPSSEIPPPYMHTAKPSLAGITFISSSWRNFWEAVLLLSLEYGTLCKKNRGLWISFLGRELGQLPPCAFPLLPLPGPKLLLWGMQSRRWAPLLRHFKVSTPLKIIKLLEMYTNLLNCISCISGEWLRRIYPSSVCSYASTLCWKFVSSGNLNSLVSIIILVWSEGLCFNT